MQNDERDELQKEAFLTGLVCSLHSAMAYDRPAIARHIVDNNTDLDELKKYIKRHGNENDADLLFWLDREYAVDT